RAKGTDWQKRNRLPVVAAELLSITANRSASEGTGGTKDKFVALDTPAARSYSCSMDHPKILTDGITFDDVLLIPSRSDFVPADASTATRLTRNIELNIPLISA